MSMAFSDKDHSDCKEAERLLDLAGWETDNEEHDRLMGQATALLSRLVEKGMPHALYLRASYVLRHEGLSDEEAEARRITMIEAAALQGHAKAQFIMGQFLDEEGELGHDPQKSAEWFRLSAEQGYPYAEWVHGLNLLHGLGVPVNERLAIEFIRRAAEGNFEEALRFIADAYSEGRHGFPVDAEQSRFWRSKLQESDNSGL